LQDSEADPAVVVADGLKSETSCAAERPDLIGWMFSFWLSISSMSIGMFAWLWVSIVHAPFFSDRE
jgi:hypothetical protein